MEFARPGLAGENRLHASADDSCRRSRITTIGTMFRNLLNTLCIGAGGAIGTILRFWISGVIANAFGERFPTGTLVVNITGSMIIGFFSALTGPEGRMMVKPLGRQFFMIGVCGGYTTFSSFSLQTLNLARENQWGLAWLNAGLSLLFCLLGVWLGFLAGESLNR
jgi:CrcB protein